MQPWSTNLFQTGNLVGLPANNQFGFDILAYQNGSYVSVLNDAKFCAQVISWLLEQQGKLHKNIGSNVDLGNVNANAAASRNTSTRRSVGAGGSGTTASTSHATTPVRRGGRSRTSINRNQTPALATSGNPGSGGGG